MAYFVACGSAVSNIYKQCGKCGNVIDLKHAAIERHANYSQIFCILENYDLSFHDFSEVISARGSTKKVKLIDYKNE